MQTINNAGNSEFNCCLAASSLSFSLARSLSLSQPCPTQRKGIEKLFNSFIFLHLFDIINFLVYYYVYMLLFFEYMNKILKLSWDFFSFLLYIYIFFLFCGVFIFSLSVLFSKFFYISFYPLLFLPSLELLFFVLFFMLLLFVFFFIHIFFTNCFVIFF